jgi:hypothetical protein
MIKNRRPKFSLDVECYRIGKAKGFLEEFNQQFPKMVKWKLKEVEVLREVYISAHAPPTLDAYVVNLEGEEEALEEVRRDFWEHMWKGWPPLPLAIILPKGVWTNQQVMESLSLIQLADRPWQIFQHSEELVVNLANWLEMVCCTSIRALEKEKLAEQTHQLP